MDIIIIILITICLLYYYNKQNIETFINKNNTAIIYQTHYFSDKIKANILKLKKDINNLNYDLWVFYDNKKNDFNIYKEWFKQNEIKYYLYTKEDCLKYYSTYAYNEYSGIYNAPAKPIIPIFNLKYNYDYIWCIEYDVIYLGDWNDIFNYYNLNKSDVITKIESNGLQNLNKSWIHWKNCNICTDNKLNAHIFLPVIRYSKKILQLIMKYLQNNKTGHHEALIGTICNKEKNCKLEDINPNFFGIYKFNPIISYNKLIDLPHNKLYHPVKELTVTRQVK